MDYCKNRHPRNKKNLYVDPRGKRQCRVCRATAIRRWYDLKGREQQGRKKRLSSEESFESKVKKNKNGCWLWQGALNEDGYGSFQGKKAHRYSYEHVNGEIFEGLELDHLCEKRNCVNPEHLEAVTHLENIRRSRARGRCENLGKHLAELQRNKKRCPKGHPYKGRNLRIDTWTRKDGRKMVARRCRICEKEKFRRYQIKSQGKS